MPLLTGRDIVPYGPGNVPVDNTLYGIEHLNLTTLKHWNYDLYSNGTLSNGSWCILTFAPYHPGAVLSNGTFINETWCWSPTEPIGVRAGIAIGYAVLFGIALVLTVVSLNKHGKLHLPAEKRFYPIGRRWQWYWASLVCATALISLLTCVDVDRYFLPELPIILTSFFWFIMQLGAIGVVWEAVRHWGSWMERQYIDPDPFSLKDDDKRAKVEFFIPLVFYLFFWLNFFMIVPRNWGNIQHQRYPEQTLSVAAPSATDTRFKVAAFFLAADWLLIVFSLRHSIKHYCPRNRGVINRIRGFIRYTPMRFLLIIPLAAALVAYQALVAWRFDYSPLKVHGNKAAIYAGGYTPALLIVYVQALYGFLNPNEDVELQRQRRVRGQELDREMGVVHKPAWWRLINGENIDTENESMRDRLMRNVREINGNTNKPAAGAPGSSANLAVAAANPFNEPVEMTPVSPMSRTTPNMTTPPLGLYTGRSEHRRQERAMEVAATMLFPEAVERNNAAAIRRRQELVMDGPMPPPSYRDAVNDRPVDGIAPPPPAVARSMSGQSEGSTNQPPQQIRSMLDV